MKKSYYLVAALLLASATPLLTGCIDNDEPAGIEDLRGAKAELTRAKAAVEKAKVAQEEAKALQEQAKAAYMQAEAEWKQAEAEIKQAEAELKKATTEAQKAELEKDIALWEAQRNAAIAKANEQQKAAEAAIKWAEKDLQDAMIAIEQAKANFTLWQKTTVDGLMAELNSWKVAVETATENLATAKKTYENGLLGNEINAIQQKFNIESAVTKAEVQLEAEKAALAKAEALLAELKTANPEQILKKQEELEKELIDILEKNIEGELAYQDWLKNEFKAGNAQLNKDDAALTLKKEEKVKIEDLTLEFDETVPYTSNVKTAQGFNEAGNKINETLVEKLSTDAQGKYSLAEAVGLPEGEMTYTQQNDYNYGSVKNELEKALRVVKAWTRDANQDAWSDVKIEEVKHNTANDEKELAEAIADWKSVVDAFYNGEKVSYDVDATKLTGYAQLSDSVDAYNADVKKVEEINAQIVAEVNKITAAQAQFDKDTADAKAAFVAATTKEVLQKQADDSLAVLNKTLNTVVAEKAKLDAELVAEKAKPTPDAAKIAEIEGKIVAKQKEVTAATEAVASFKEAEVKAYYVAEAKKTMDAVYNPETKTGTAQDKYAAVEKSVQTNLTDFQLKHGTAMALVSTDKSAKIEKAIANFKDSVVYNGQSPLSPSIDAMVNAYVDARYAGKATTDAEAQEVKALVDAQKVLDKAGLSFTLNVVAPLSLDVKMIALTDHDGAKGLIEARSAQIWGTYFTNAYGASNARLVELTEEDVIKLLVDEEGNALRGLAYVKAAQSYGEMGALIATQKEIKLQEGYKGNDATVKGFVDKITAALDKLNKEFEAGEEAIKAEEKRISDKKAELDVLNKTKKNELTSIEAASEPTQEYLSYLNGLLNTWIENYNLEDENGNKVYSYQAYEDLIEKLSSKDPEKIHSLGWYENEVAEKEVAVAMAKKQLEQYNAGKLDLNKANAEAVAEAEAKLAKAQENLTKATAELQKWLDKLAF